VTDPDLVRAIQDLTDEIRKYRRIKERGVELAERIEADRERYQP
jgi:hypothetical protein